MMSIIDPIFNIFVPLEVLDFIPSRRRRRRHVFDHAEVMFV